MIKLIKRNRKGFTMIEVLVAVFILTIGILASYSIIQQMLVYTFSSSARLTAAYLAEEGVEMVRNIRDTAWINGLPWGSNGLAAGHWEGRYGNYHLTPCSGECDYATMGFVSYAGSSSNNRFKRKITIERSGSSPIKVTVVVVWTERGGNNNVTVQSYLYDWK